MPQRSAGALEISDRLLATCCQSWSGLWAPGSRQDWPTMAMGENDVTEAPRSERRGLQAQSRLPGPHEEGREANKERGAQAVAVPGSTWV